MSLNSFYLTIYECVYVCVCVCMRVCPGWISKREVTVLSMVLLCKDISAGFLRLSYVNANV